MPFKPFLSHRLIFAGLFCSAVIALTSCKRPQPATAEFYVFGTLVDVSLEVADSSTANSTFAELQQMFQSMHEDWHAWEPGKLTRINDAFSAGHSAAADEHIVTLIKRSQEFEITSGGRFNPAIGQLVGAWGFHTSDYPIKGPAPASSLIEALLAGNPSMQDVLVAAADEGHWLVSSSNSSVQLDFGGIAKGYAVDLAIETIAARKLEGGMVNAGGDLRAFGHTQGRSWRVAVENPLGGIIGVVEIEQDEAVFTSGNYQRYGEDDSGVRYAHILDPRSGRPVPGLISATVIASSGIAADAAATALAVAGLDEWQQVAREMKLDAFLFTDEDGRIHLSPAMQKRLQRSSENRNEMIVLE